MRPARVARVFAPIVGALLVAASIVGCGDQRDLAGRDGVEAGPGFDPGDAGDGFDAGEPIDLEAGPPYAVLGLAPSHGPFTGGTRVEIRGRGFSSKTKVRLGTIEVPAVDVIPVDPYHVQIITPPGEPGSADVIVEDEPSGQTAVLPFGFTYDSFHADPSSGATTGGTLVTLLGRGTAWTTGTTVTIDGKPCGDLVVADATRLTCVAPAGTPGAKSISVTTPDKVVTTVRDAYVYSDSDDGYRGGLAGEKLPGELKVLALANPSGDLLPGATVVVRGKDGVVLTGTTSTSGVASFPSPPAPPLTVTVAMKCLQPTTFDGVEVRSVTAYLWPVLSTACVPPDGQPPPTGGKARNLGVVSGELVWPGAIEFKRAPWKGVPDPKKPTQRVAAYVFAAAGSNTARFSLPDPAQAVLPTSPGTLGYQFTTALLPGNVTLYAIAGLEDRPEGEEPTFDPYVYGVVRGVGVTIGGVVDRVTIPMTGTFTHEARYAVSGVPISSRGPDRLRSTVAVDLGQGFMLLPQGARENLLPLSGEVPFVGVPPLSGLLSTSSYVASFEAVTGGVGGVPASAVLRFRSRTSGAPVAISSFVPLPKIVSPAPAAPWDARTVKIDLPAGSADLVVVEVSAADGSTGWTIVAPGSARSVELPDFSAKPELGLPGGSLVVGATAARLDAFDYDQVRYGQLGRAAWTAYAYDTAFGYW